MELSQFTFFSHLSSELQQFVHTHARPITVAKNTILFYQGDVCKDILLLTEGNVRLYIQGEEIEEITLYTLKPLEQCVVNTASLVAQNVAIGTAITENDISGYLLDHESIRSLMSQSPEYLSFIFSLFTLRLASLATLVEDIKFKRLDVRLLEWLAHQENNRIEMTHEQIATQLGTSRVVISRLLKDLEHKGKVKLERGAINKLT
ncbi:MAG: Crp/Fnr family transcriptional regulator [Sulfuricurvum sp.]|uniref:Crp/Fnr family transcriptional regulator n=1 Tax=Sulfuricurvum sp. TaxID=2025608 RepID=UPI002725CC0B|nr:Crp/Fnr family transcriptional regulator [Sulfuricurvum sp.]MDO9056999.1 Crp/Fnr family transcriptional regulator [Sulfuricurvum sp.]MDP3291707.1 Crp/Fnr family transcriptional regulator [Sulfuricurvum sp.]